MQKLRVVLLLLLIPFAPRFGKHAAVAWSSVDAVWSERTLSPEDRVFRTTSEQLTDLHRRPGEPQPGDWRSTVVQPAQSFAQYAQSNPVRRDEVRNTIYVQPIGDFNAAQESIVNLSAEFLGIYYSSPVRILPTVSADIVPSTARRIHPGAGHEQFLPYWINHEFLKPQLPDDAVACIALTTTDLWPGKNYNFVFGQASLVDRVGVWSIARHGDPEIGPAEYNECLLRALKTAAHETGHMFSMEHCLHFECVMAGKGSLAEGDRHPLYLCPECLAKLHWNLHSTSDPPKAYSSRDVTAERFRKLAQFCETNDLNTAADYYNTAREMLKHSER